MLLGLSNKVRKYYALHLRPVVSLLYTVLFSGRTVVAQGYMGPYGLIGRTESQYAAVDSVLSDANDATCMPTTKDDTTLQAVFRIPNGRQMSVEVILGNATDCTSPAWNWFVESECSAGGYLECSQKTLDISSSQTLHCEISCGCLLSCDYLYLKYYRIPWAMPDHSVICEVRSGDIEPSTYP